MGRETIYLCYDFRRFSKAGDDRNVNESRKYLSTDRGGGDALEPKRGGGGGGGVRGRSIATGLGRKPVGGCYSAAMRRPAIRSTAHDPILSYPTYQPPIQDVSLQISVTNCVPLRGYTISPVVYFIWADNGLDILRYIKSYGAARVKRSFFSLSNSGVVIHICSSYFYLIPVT